MRGAFRTMLVLVALWLAVGVQAQPFYRVYGAATGPMYGSCIATMDDGSYVVGGGKQDSALVMRVGPDGQVIWASCFRPSSRPTNVIVHLSITPDGFLIGSGTGAPNNTLYDKAFLFKMDPDGNLIWHRQSNAGMIPILANRLMAVDSSQYMLIGGYYDMGAATRPDVFTGLLNAADGGLDLINPRMNYGDPAYIDDAHCATLSPSGAVYLGGRIYVDGSSPGGMRAFITKVDAQGGHLSSRYLLQSSSGTGRIYGTDITYCDDSLALAFMGDAVGTSTNHWAGIIRTDTLGNIKWGRRYMIDGAVRMESHTLLRMPYGFALTGHVERNAQKDLFVIATDRTGEILWAKIYGTMGSDEWLFKQYSLHAAAVGSELIMTGTLHTTGSPRRLILCKVDSTGSTGCGMETEVAVTSHALPTESYPLSPTFSSNPFLLTPMGTVFGTTTVEEECPSIDLELTVTGEVCEPQTLDATTDGANGYLWSTGEETAGITVDEPGTYWVSVSVGCCLYMDTVVVEWAHAPTAAFIADMDDCGLSASFINGSTGANQYAWDFGDGTSGSGENPDHTYAEPGMYTVTLIAANACGSDTASQVVQGSMPSGMMIVGPERICLGHSVELYLTYSSDSLTDILWSTGDMTPSITITPDDEMFITATATDANGCTLEASYQLQVIAGGGTGPIPNVFTPNNDGSNDAFTPIKEAQQGTLMIYNRWGQLIYESDNPKRGWQGTQGGKPSPDGTYFYILNWFDACDRVQKEQTGHVTLLR